MIRHWFSGSIVTRAVIKQAQMLCSHFVCITHCAVQRFNLQILYSNKESYIPMIAGCVRHYVHVRVCVCVSVCVCVLGTAVRIIVTIVFMA